MVYGKIGLVFCLSKFLILPKLKNQTKNENKNLKECVIREENIVTQNDICSLLRQKGEMMPGNTAFYFISLFYFHLFYFLSVYFEREESVWTVEGQRERERERENPKQALCCKHRAWIGAQFCESLRSWPELKSRFRRLTNRLSHPAARKPHLKISFVQQQRSLWSHFPGSDAMSLSLSLHLGLAASANVSSPSRLWLCLHLEPCSLGSARWGYMCPWAWHHSEQGLCWGLATLHGRTPRST